MSESDNRAFDRAEVALNRSKTIEENRREELEHVNAQTRRPDMTAAKTIVSLSAADTAEWLGGNKPVDWMDHHTDVDERANYERFKLRMKDALHETIKIYASCLDVDSKQTAARLRSLADQMENARGHDKRPGELLIVLLNELMRAGAGVGAR